MQKLFANALVLAAALTILGVLDMRAGRAQEVRSGGGAVSAQLVAELQQLSAESTALKARNAQLEQQLAAAQKERDALKKGVQASALRVRSSQAALARSNAQATGDQQRIAVMQASEQQLITKFRELVAILRKTEIGEATAKQTLAMRERDLEACTDRNQALYKIDEDVVRHVANRGFFARLASDEPFTRIERVRLQNYLLETHERAGDQRYAPPASGVPQE